MNKRTGDLFEGHRICLFDKTFEEKKDIGHGVSVTMGTFTHDGWILFHPGMGLVPIFLNRKSEDWFEILGGI